MGEGRKRDLCEAGVVIVRVDVHRAMAAEVAQQRHQVRAAAARGEMSGAEQRASG
jgi:hypothetical protein